MVTDVGFDEAKHMYTYQGKRVLSVSQILSRDQSIPPSPAMERGTRMHKKQEWDELHVTPRSVTRHLGLTNTQVEQRGLYMKNGVPLYAGTADLIGYLNGQKVIVDHKSGRLYPGGCEKYHMQVAAYGLIFGATRGFIYYLDFKVLVEIPAMYDATNAFLFRLCDFLGLNYEEYFGHLSYVDPTFSLYKRRYEPFERPEWY